MILPYFPNLVRKIAGVGDAWLVSRAALLDGQVPKDLDIMIPFESWHLISPLIPESAKPNTFGGWKFETEGVLVDIWPDSLSRLATRIQFKAAYHFGTGVQLIVNRGPVQ